MKIAITSLGRDMDSQVDPRFGRAKFFIVVDTDTGSFEVADNEQNLKAAQGAGIQSGVRVVELGAKALLTGHVGPKAFATLDAGGIEVYSGVGGTIAQAVEKFKSGELANATKPDVDGHWV